VTLKLVVSRSRPSVPYGANFIHILNPFSCIHITVGGDRLQIW